MNDLPKTPPKVIRLPNGELLCRLDDGEEDTTERPCSLSREELDRLKSIPFVVDEPPAAPRPPDQPADAPAIAAGPELAAWLSRTDDL
jgi:hypothetical protein